MADRGKIITECSLAAVFVAGCSGVDKVTKDFCKKYN